MRKTIRWCMIFAVALATVVVSHAVPPPEKTSPRAYVTNSMGDDVTVIDIGTMKAIADIKVGEKVHGVCAPADGRHVFFTIESAKTFRIVDTTTNEIVATIPLSGDPNQCAATPDGHFAVVPIRDIGGVDIIDVAERKIVKHLPLKVPHNCYSARSNDFLYCESRGAEQISRIDLKKLDYSQATAVGGDPRPFAVSTDGNRMYVALSGFHGFAAINLSENGAIQRVNLPAEPQPPSPCEKFEGNTPTHGLDLSPDGKELWVTSLADGGVYVYDVASTKISKEISTGQCPNWISFSADGKYLAVSNSASDDTSIIDTKTRKEIARVKVGKVPKRLLMVSVPAA